MTNPTQPPIPAPVPSEHEQTPLERAWREEGVQLWPHLVAQLAEIRREDEAATCRTADEAAEEAA